MLKVVSWRLVHFLILDVIAGGHTWESARIVQALSEGQQSEFLIFTTVASILTEFHIVVSLRCSTVTSPFDVGPLQDIGVAKESVATRLRVLIHL